MPLEINGSKILIIFQFLLFFFFQYLVGPLMLKKPGFLFLFFFFFFILIYIKPSSMMFKICMICNLCIGLAIECIYCTNQS